MKDVGIVGLPQSGKTTLYNALTRAGAPAGGAAGKASVAAVPVPDSRVDVLAELERSRKRVFVQARFVDVAGLSAGGSGPAAHGPGGPGGSSLAPRSVGGPGGASLAPRYLGSLREADALAMVLAAWDESGRDPAEAAAELILELTVADLESIAGGADKAAKKAKAGVKDAALEASVLARARDLLDRGTPLRAADWEPEEARVLRNFAPLTLKPALAVLNLAEADAARAAERAAEAEAKLGLPTVAVAAALEAEAAELPPEDAADLLAGYGIERGGLDQVVGAAWRLLDLLTFLTTGEDETRAWEVRRGATAPEAAGRIHSDLQRGFIRAEVIPYEDVVAAGGWDAARAQGLLRTEARSYVVQEGDVLHVRFNV
jgi:ribosome-binding ATPase